MPISFPPTVELKASHCAVSGQQASPGKHRQLLDGVGDDMPSYEPKGIIEGIKPIMLVSSEFMMAIKDEKSITGV